ncbi:hypothetical protein S40293_05733 [Stachybotrys chartarum IBT 40293]|nr:hypothetical protein S40293_05733 [Stachybotrys chartarum IBT 40293]
MPNSTTLYEPLNVNRLEIRVLNLECSQDSDSEIRGFLNIQSLMQNDESRLKPYEALSYTWGSGLASQNILINGTSVSVGANLESFLRIRRHTTETVRLWIDAICINQNDGNEKSSQIPFMSSIYKYAHEVTIWLGPAADNSDLAMQEMRELGSGSPYDKIPIMERQVLDAFNQLLNRPWWSRVWIIQEVVFGGIGAGMEKLRVTCGHQEISWSVLVIAATRMMSYKIFKRQYFPGISHILELESLREDAFLLSKRMTRASQSTGTDAKLAICWSLELVSRYRRFKATEAKDKVYALALMFKSRIPVSLTPDYSAPLNIVYRDFAEWSIRGMGDLEILKHCGSASARGLPGWVPDWSLDPGCLPLPSSKRSLRAGVPWWSDPDENVDGSMGSYRARPIHEDEAEHEREARIRMKQLQIGSGALVKLDDIQEMPQSHYLRQVIDQLPQEFKTLFNKLTRDNRIIGMAVDIAEIEASLESATEFLVAIGQCKAMAEYDEAAVRRYPSLEERIKAFWLTILVGQIPASAIQTGGDLFSDYMTWLPPVPPSWTTQAPQLTVTTTGLLWYAEGAKIFDEATSSYQKINNLDSTLSYSSFSPFELDGLVPKEWTPADCQAYTIKFQNLADLWRKQRYDLYHTPFETLNIVPDPYWHHRQNDDDLAQRKALRWARTDEIRVGSDESSQYIVKEAERIRKSRVSMVPYSMLENDIEKFMLGRRFFVTEQGYFGLAPKEAQVGDKIAIVFGSDVPLVLKQSQGESRALIDWRWKMVGEAYVNDLMQGEALEDTSAVTSINLI